MNKPFIIPRLLLLVGIVIFGQSNVARISRGADVASFESLAEQYASATRPLLQQFCLDCHSSAEMQGDLDLERFENLADVRQSPLVWPKVVEMLENGEMPPDDADQPSRDQRDQLLAWIARYLHAEAHAHAGDPGPVVLRRLNNAEYTYTIRDLTGIALTPAREFPSDSAAGEGFTNTGNSLVMSPALLSKYFEAGKQIASHAVLLPDGIRFSPGTTARDWTDETLAEIRALYNRYADEEGKIPLEKYLLATIEQRDELSSGRKTTEQVAAERGLSAKYLGILWTELNSQQSSLLLDSIRNRWRTAVASDAGRLAAEIQQWQLALTEFRSVGHMQAWLANVEPLVSTEVIRFPMPKNSEENTVTLYLAADSAGDGSEHDYVVWQQPRLVTPGQPDLLLRDVRAFVNQTMLRRERVFASAANSLEAAAEASEMLERPNIDELAAKHGVDPDILAGWLDYLGIGAHPAANLHHLAETITSASNYDFVKGWGNHETPLLVANSSDQHVRIPGNMRPGGVAVHPSPALNIAVAWESPISGLVNVAGRVTHAHPECGNGVQWWLELRRGQTRQRLAAGNTAGASPSVIDEIQKIPVQQGDLLSLIVGPRDANHACDLTDIDFTIHSPADARTWNVCHDVSPDVLAGNPHADRFGNEHVWHFYTEPVAENAKSGIVPAGSLLARWQLSQDRQERRQLAAEVQKLLTEGCTQSPEHPDALLYRQLASLGGPLFSGTRGKTLPSGAVSAPENDTQWGVDPAWFGTSPTGETIDAASLCVKAPSVIEITLPADLVADSELAVTAAIHEPRRREAGAQVQIAATRPELNGLLQAGRPVLVADDSVARARFSQAFQDFRQLFPAGLCYRDIVPVDEVVTLTLFHREDEHLARLMLTADESKQLDRLWSELHFVSQDALTIVDAFAQLMEYATQDSDPRKFEPFRKPIHDNAAAFRQLLVDCEPRHVDALVRLAESAYRRPLEATEAQQLRDLYQRLRAQGLSHSEAFRLVLARVFVAPAFLYRLEQAPPGVESGPVNDWELANRLSYFLWSSMPDEDLRSAAASGRLSSDHELVHQTRRMLKDERVRRLAVEFACQWMQVYEFDALDEKSERHFPTFNDLRDEMYEEPIRFFTDLCQNDGSVLSLLDADHTFLNEKLADHYGIEGVTGDHWRRVEGVRRYSRGGILGFGATLSKQSGASRTSPILRGTWVSEVLLGEKLPRPPKDVPVLPDDETATAELTVRQLVERHSSDERCAKCHVRIDPFGFSLEAFDAIGRFRDKDLAGRPIDVSSALQDGTAINGLEGLRNYLLHQRRDAFVKQFCRKLLGYALGRGVQLSDEPLLDEMQQKLRENEYRFSVAVEMIVLSPQFRMIRGRDAAADDAVASE